MRLHLMREAIRYSIIGCSTLLETSTLSSMEPWVLSGRRYRWGPLPALASKCSSM